MRLSNSQARAHLAHTRGQMRKVVALGARVLTSARPWFLRGHSSASTPASGVALRAAAEAEAVPQAAAQTAGTSTSESHASTKPALHRLEDLPWDHSFIQELPGDKETKNFVRQVQDALYSRVHPTPAAGEPYTLAWSPEVAEMIGLDPTECERPEFPLVFSGAAPLPGTQPYAQCYGGHQFGMWAGQLGDGRAITLGEVLVTDSVRDHNSESEGKSEGEGGKGVRGVPRRYELQLKGAGKTPYSRRADGRAVLRSSLREFVASEAMAALGVPTTRALCLVGTGDLVLRDMFYDGRAKYEPGAVVCRVAPSFVRFGTFQLPASRGGGQEQLARQLADYVIKYHYPELLDTTTGNTAAHTNTTTNTTDSPSASPATGTATSAATATATSSDASHTDSQQASTSQGSENSNGSSSNGQGLVKPQYIALLREVCRRTGRLVAKWQSVGFVHGVLNSDNMSILGLTIDYGPYGFLDKFDPFYTPNITDAEGRRYSFRNQPEAVQFNLVMLANALLAADMVVKEQAEEALGLYSLELTIEYNRLIAAKLGFQAREQGLSAELMKLMYDCDADWTNTFRALSSVTTEGDPSVPSTSLPPPLRAAIGTKDFTPEREAAWCAWLDKYKAKLREVGVPDAERQAAQNRVNPKFIPRQHLLQYAIEAAEQGDNSELDRLLTVLQRPYDEQPEADPKYSQPPPEDMVRPGVCMLSCSS